MTSTEAVGIVAGELQPGARVSTIHHMGVDLASRQPVPEMDGVFFEGSLPEPVKDTVPEDLLKSMIWGIAAQRVLKQKDDIVAVALGTNYATIPEMGVHIEPASETRKVVDPELVRAAMTVVMKEAEVGTVHVTTLSEDIPEGYAEKVGLEPDGEGGYKFKRDKDYFFPTHWNIVPLAQANQ